MFVPLDVNVDVRLSDAGSEAASMVTGMAMAPPG